MPLLVMMFQDIDLEMREAECGYYRVSFLLFYRISGDITHTLHIYLYLS